MGPQTNPIGSIEGQQAQGGMPGPGMVTVGGRLRSRGGRLVQMPPNQLLLNIGLAEGTESVTTTETNGRQSPWHA